MSTGNGQRHTISNADNLYAGSAYYPVYQGGKRGLPVPHIYVQELGAVSTKDVDGVCATVTATATGAQSLTIGGALASGGVATFTTPRAVSLTSTGDESGVNFTVTGTDRYGKTQVETIAGPNNTTVNTKAAYLTVSGVTISGQMTASDMNVGESDILGLEFHLSTVGKFLGLTQDGVATTGYTVVAGSTSTGTTTATTGDVRGTVTATAAPDGSKLFTAMYVINHNNKEAAFGATPFAG